MCWLFSTTLSGRYTHLVTRHIDKATLFSGLPSRARRPNCWSPLPGSGPSGSCGRLITCSRAEGSVHCFPAAGFLIFLPGAAGFLIFLPGAEGAGIVSRRVSIGVAERHLFRVVSTERFTYPDSHTKKDRVTDRSRGVYLDDLLSPVRVGGRKAVSCRWPTKNLSIWSASLIRGSLSCLSCSVTTYGQRQKLSICSIRSIASGRSEFFTSG